MPNEQEQALQAQLDGLNKFANRVYAKRFLEKCAEFGMTPENEDDAMELFKIAGQLVANGVIPADSSGVSEQEDAGNMVKAASATLEQIFGPAYAQDDSPHIF